jgi:NAD(P)H-quinone oxidoreductase subunit 5
MAGARRLSFTTSGRSQAYALTLLLGVLLMAAWLLAFRPSLPTELLRVR